jgi:uncharacterized protein (TIGR02145 family)
MKKAARFGQCMFCSLIALVMIFASSALFSQVVLDGNVADNGGEFLGSGAESVEGALVTLIELSSGESQSVYTDENGYYSFEITLTGIHEDDFAQPSVFKVLQNYPNPFNPSTIIPFQIPGPAHITLEVYNILGRKVRTLIDGYQSSSGYVVWDAADDMGRGVPAGVYIYTLKAEEMRSSRKMLLLDGHQAGASAAVSAFEAPVSIAPPVMHKTSLNEFRLTVESEDIEAFEQEIEITGNRTFDVTVYRTMTGNDGRVYRTVKIGDQWWMAENLRETKYRNGNEIPEVTDNAAWTALSTGARCAYDNSSSNADTYGYLYNWFAAADAGKIAPAGWRVPTDADWKVLEMVLGMSQANADNWGWRGSPVGSKLAGNADLWDSGSLENHSEFGTSGFSAFPAGWRHGTNGSFSSLNGYAAFWSAAEYTAGSAWYRGLYRDYTDVGRGNDDKTYGFSVRLIQGDDIAEHTVSTPAAPSGPSSGQTGESLSYSTGGSACSQGHDVQYRFDWGDGTASSWGSSSQSKSF